ncbi:MAG: hypothetical protein IPP49_17940 [Saprospiraceae bacterium]|nr:hypothetical protein [Saprospiraceae bacterium]
MSEIKRNPGGNRDISRVIQSLPGFTSSASFRNDLIIREGLPTKTVFVDDVEVPVINHFSTKAHQVVLRVLSMWTLSVKWIFIVEHFQ